MDSGLSDCADRIEREIRKESNMERRNLMELRETIQKNSTYPTQESSSPPESRGLSRDMEGGCVLVRLEGYCDFKLHWSD